MAARTSQLDWVAAGLKLLRDGGPDALTIERLCAALRKTKGSFYHHFVDIDRYHSALLERWATLHTELPIRAADRRVRSAAERRRALSLAVRKVDLGLELAVHAWAVRSPIARAACDRVHERRVDYLAALRDGRHTRADAEVEYAAFIGSLHVAASEPERRDAINRRVQALLPVPSRRPLR